MNSGRFALAVGILLLTAGCTGSGTSIRSVDPSGTAPSADKSTASALDGTVRTVFAAVARAYESGDTRPLDGLTTPACVLCQGWKKAAKALAERKVRVSQPDVAMIVRSVGDIRAESGRATVSVRVDEPALPVDPAAKAAARTERGYRVGLVLDRGGWLVDEITESVPPK